MKKVKISTDENEIDWSKPQWLIHEKSPLLIVLSHGVLFGDNFRGTALPCESYPDGLFATDWEKIEFKPLTYSINFEISNNED